MAQAPSFVGIAVAKDRLDVHLHPEDQALTLAHHETSFRALARRFRRQGQPALALEASGGYEKPLARHLAKAGFRVYVLDPAQVRALARGIGRRAKTDPIDARMIARCLEATLHDRVPFQPDPLADRLQALVSFRAKLVQERTALTGYRAALDEPLVRRLVRTRLIGLKLAIARLDHTIRATIDQHPDAAGSFRRLTSVPGVGPVLAATLLALLPELGRISPKAVAAPGSPPPAASPATATGAAAAAAAAAGSAASSTWRRWPRSAPATRRAPASTTALRRAGKPAKKAIVACMRQLLTILNASLAITSPGPIVPADTQLLDPATRRPAGKPAPDPRVEAWIRSMAARFSERAGSSPLSRKQGDPPRLSTVAAARFALRDRAGPALPLVNLSLPSW
jgi:transposase